MKITVIVDGQEKEIELSDEQIIAIGRKYYELDNQNLYIGCLGCEYQNDCYDSFSHKSLNCPRYRKEKTK